MSSLSLLTLCTPGSAGKLMIIQKQRGPKGDKQTSLELVDVTRLLMVCLPILGVTHSGSRGSFLLACPESWAIPTTPWLFILWRSTTDYMSNAESRTKERDHETRERSASKC